MTATDTPAATPPPVGRRGPRAGRAARDALLLFLALFLAGLVVGLALGGQDQARLGLWALGAEVVVLLVGFAFVARKTREARAAQVALTTLFLCLITLVNLATGVGVAAWVLNAVLVVFCAVIGGGVGALARPTEPAPTSAERPVGADPFDRPWARYLLPWALVAAVVSELPAALFWPDGFSEGDPAGMLANGFGFLLFTLLLGVVPLAAARRAGLEPRRFYAPLAAREIPALAFLAVPMVALTCVTLYAVYAPLSLVLPDWTQWWLYEDEPLLYADTQPYPLMGNLVALAAVALVGPLAEEWFFRGLLLRRWTRRWGPRAAVLASSVVFGVLHADLVGATIFGIVMCALAARFGTLWAPTVVHVANNALAMSLEAAAVHGLMRGLPETVAELRAAWWLPVGGLLLLLPWLPRARRAWRGLPGWSFAVPLLLLAGVAGAPSPPVLEVDALAPGPHAVGYRAALLLDATRAYRTTFDDGATHDGDARPILLNLWYPATVDADAAPLAHGAYFAPVDAPPELSAWAGAVAEHARDTACELLLDAPPEALDPPAADLWRQLLARPTRAFANAPPLPGPFPFVVHHSGAGSSYEDDAGLAEHLASHGYVVLGSAYPEADGSGLGVDGGAGSVADMAFLAAHAASLPFVDGARGAYVGHSLGAQVCLRAAAADAAPVRALVLLDSTLDDHSPELPTYARVVQPVRAGVEHVDQALLVAAGPGAAFLLCDELVAADRSYLQIPELGHDEFIQQGLLRLTVDARADAARAERVRALHAELVHAVRLFLDAELARAPAPFEALRAAWAARPPDGRAPRAEHAPPGTRGPPPWDPQGAPPPTPRQLRPAHAALGMDRLLEELDARLAQHRDHPVYTATMLHASLLHDLAVAERLDEARALLRWTRRRMLRPLGTLRFLATMGELLGRPEDARHYLSVAVTLDPGDVESLGRLRRLAPEAAER